MLGIVGKKLEEFFLTLDRMKSWKNLNFFYGISRNF
jgi:hypothetical protein